MSVIKFLAIALILPMLVAACGPTQEESATAAIAVSLPDSEAIDYDVIVANTQQEVEKILPGAYLGYVSLVADCADLAELRGSLRLMFLQRRFALFGDRVWEGWADVDTAIGNVVIQTHDISTHDPNLDPFDPTGLSIEAIAAGLQDYLGAKGRCMGTVVLSRGANANWWVRCGPPDEVFLECLKIDAATGDIQPAR